MMLDLLIGGTDLAFGIASFGRAFNPGKSRTSRFGADSRRTQQSTMIFECTVVDDMCPLNVGHSTSFQAHAPARLRRFMAFIVALWSLSAD